MWWARFYLFLVRETLEYWQKKNRIDLKKIIDNLVSTTTNNVDCRPDFF